MSKEIVEFRLASDLLDQANQESDDQGMSLAEWMRDAVEAYLGYDKNDEPTVDELEKMNFDELADVVDDLGLKIKVKDFDTGDQDNDPDDLCTAIEKELGLFEDPFDDVDG